jgi:omega-amidase
MQNLKVALLQTDLLWEDSPGNLKKFDGLIASVLPGTDLILLPEMFNTGFSMDPVRLAQTMDGEVVTWMKLQAMKSRTAIAGSVIIEENGHYFNRLIWMFPDGNLRFYDKRHRFTMAGEQNHYTAGDKRVIVEYKGWRFLTAICYDMRFPVWLRNTGDYDCLVVSANWPERRIIHWEHLLYARAIENQCFLLAVNRVGKDGTGMEHNGCSMVMSPMGKPLSKAIDIETILYAELDYSLVSKTRNDMPFLNDRDDFRLI